MKILRFSFFVGAVLLSFLLSNCARYPAIPELDRKATSEISQTGGQQKMDARVRQMLLSLKKNDEGDYVIGKKDVLHVEVWGQSDLNRTVEVSQDGTINLPLIGNVPADGRTVSELKEEITQKLKGPFLINPQVTVSVVKYESKTVSVLGEVGGRGGKGSGKYPLKGRTTLLEILTEAGLSEQASDECIVIRPNKGKRGAAGEEDPETKGMVIRLNLTDLMKGDLVQNIELQNGDTIYLPAAENFYVFGEVHSPGKYRYKRGMTVLKAVSTAGGLTEKAASIKRVKILREEGGERKRISVNPTDLVKPEDTIIVPESFF